MQYTMCCVLMSGSAGKQRDPKGILQPESQVYTRVVRYWGWVFLTARKRPQLKAALQPPTIP